MQDEEQGSPKDRGASRKSSLVDVHVGARVRLRRLALGFTLQELSSQVGISFQQLQKYEAGDSRMPVSRLHAIAQVLDVPITWFFAQLATTKSKRVTSTEGSLQQEADRLVSLYSAIDDPRVRRAIVELVTLLSELSGK